MCTLDFSICRPSFLKVRLLMTQKHKRVVPSAQKAARGRKSSSHTLGSSRRSETPSHSEKNCGEKRKINILEALEPMLCLLTCLKKNTYIVNWNLGCAYLVATRVTAHSGRSLCSAGQWSTRLSPSFFWPTLWPCHSCGPDLRHTLGFIALWMLYEEIYISSSCIWIPSLSLGHSYVSKFAPITLLGWPLCWKKWLS